MKLFPNYALLGSLKLFLNRILFCMVIIFMGFGCNSKNEEIKLPKFKEAQELILSRRDGSEIKLSSWKGKPVILNIWATWCPPCVEEIPSLIEFAKTVKKELGIDIIAVSMDDDWADVELLFKKLKLGKINDSPLIVVQDKHLMVTKKYGTTKFPETFFINKNFEIQRKFLGSQNWVSPQILQWMANYAK